MLGRTVSDLREAVADVRGDAERHMERITSSVENGTELLTMTIMVVGLIAAAALLIAVIGFSDD